MEKILWKPSEDQIKQTNMHTFMTEINHEYNKNIKTYKELWQWSVENISDFWAHMWDFAEIIASKKADQIIDDVNKMPGTKWFTGARLNFAQNLLRFRDNQTAIVFLGENQVYRKLSYAALYDHVARLARSLKESGVKAGDRVVGFMPNMPESIIAMLAASSIGATWSSCSPDFGIKGVLDRFGQIQPKVLFSANGYFFKGKKIDSLNKIERILKQIDSVEKVVIIPYTEKNPDISNIAHSVLYENFISSEIAQSIHFEQLPFDHPLYIMYSS